MKDKDLILAIEYVHRHGNEVERSRLRYLLDGEPATAEVRESFERSQRNDGGWAPPWSPDYSSIDATCFQLTLAGQAGIEPNSPLMIDAVRFLAERQRSDGSWQEEESEAANAPPWAHPDDTSAHLYLTANAGLRMALIGIIPASADRAADFLRARQQADGSLASYLQTCWLAAALWQQTGQIDTTASTIDYLASRLLDLSAGNLAWMILALREGGIPADDPIVKAGLERLLSLRDPAGHWPADEGAGNAVHVTLETLKSLQLCGYRI
jgi:squalene cyclase